MALYEFFCDQCNHYETYSGYNGPPEDPKCPICACSVRRIYGFATTNMPTQAGRKMRRK